MVNLEFKYFSILRHHRKNKLKAVKYKGGSCLKCGYDKSVSALVFHHRNPKEKDFKISAKGNSCWDKIKTELDKCDMLCSNCHAEIHDIEREKKYKENENKFKHKSKSKSKVKVKIKIRNRKCKCLKRFKPTSKKQKFCSTKCSNKFKNDIAWPSDTALKEMIWQAPATTIAKQLGVSSSAIKKRCKLKEINTPPRGYWSGVVLKNRNEGKW